MNETKIYLGDGVYFRWDGYCVVLTTENGVSIENAIYLDPEVLAKLRSALKELELDS